MGKEAKARALRRSITKLHEVHPDIPAKEAVQEREVKEAILPLVHKVRSRTWRRSGLGKRQ